MIYTVTMNPAVDLIIALHAPLQAGEVNRAASEAFFFGGKGVNVSLVLRELGVESTALGFSAGFTGAALEEYLASKEIAAKFIRLKNGFSRINVKLLGESDTEINNSGPAVDAGSLEAFYRSLDSLTAADTLVLSGSAPQGVPKDIYASAAACANHRGARLVVDAAGDLLRSALPHHPFLIKPNREELSALFGAPCDTEAAVIDRMYDLQESGAQNVLVSLGGDGALLRLANGETYRAPAAKGKTVSTTAAGDSMLAGVLAALSRGASFPEALALGTAAGGATAFSAGVADRERILSVFETVKDGVIRIG